MIILSRLLLAAVAALFLLIGTGLLFNTTEAAAGMGLVDITAAGRGTVRADIAGFFLGGALIQLVAVIGLTCVPVVACAVTFSTGTGR